MHLVSDKSPIALQSIMPTAPKDLENILQGRHAVVNERPTQSPIYKDVVVGDTRPSPVQPNELDEDLAKEAAKKYKKKRKKIQKACAALDQDAKNSTPKGGCGASCIIL